MEELVSILIPVYNREQIINETLDCVLSQTYKHIEVIISDNKSTDGTWNILQEYAKKDSRIKIFQNKQNLGPVLNWKVCLDKATGKYAKILWSDDKMSDTFIEYTLPLMDDDTAFVLTGIRIFEGDKTIQEGSLYLSEKIYRSMDYIYNVSISNELEFPVSPGCALFRLKDLKKAFIVDIPNVENLDFKSYGAGNDLLFFLITALHYKYVKVLQTIESFYRMHPDSITVTHFEKLEKYYEWAIYYFIKNYLPAFTRKYKTKLLFRKMKGNKEFNILFRSISGPLSLSVIRKMITKKMKLK